MSGGKIFLVFKVKEQNFAYEAENVVETVKVERVFPVPLSPDYIVGVLNLRNNVIPLVDLKTLFWGERSSSDTAVIVEVDGRPIGLLVEEVVGIEEGEVKRARKVEGVKKEFVRGMFEKEGKVVFLVDLRSLTGTKKRRRKESRKVQREEVEASKGESLKGFVVFPSGREWFALPVEEVREIIDFPSKVSKVPKAPDYVEGVFLLRGEEIPLLSFPKAVGLEEVKENRAIVVKVKGRTLALGVEDVKEIRWVGEGGILKRGEGMNVIPLDGGERLALVVSAEELVRFEDIEDISSEGGEEKRAEVRRMRSFISFTVGDIEMAIPIEKVKEVIEVTSLVPMPNAPKHIEGVYNLRNSVIAVSSLPKRLGIKGAEESNKVVVLEGKPVGFKVSKLKGILRVEEDMVEPADRIESVEEKVLEGIIKTKEGGVIFVLDPDKVLKEEDIKFLKEGKGEDEGER